MRSIWHLFFIAIRICNHNNQEKNNVALMKMTRWKLQNNLDFWNLRFEVVRTFLDDIVISARQNYRHRHNKWRIDFIKEHLTIVFWEWFLNFKEFSIMNENLTFCFSRNSLKFRLCRSNSRRAILTFVENRNFNQNEKNIKFHLENQHLSKSWASMKNLLVWFNFRHEKSSRSRSMSAWRSWSF